MLPVFRQDPSGTRSPSEERRRADRFVDDLRGACEYRAGNAIAVDAALRGGDQAAGYAAALRRLGFAAGWFWAFGSRGVVLVRTGDASTGDLALTLHIVPVKWVSVFRTAPGDVHVDLAWTIDALSTS